jgi:hypothetical protein
MTLPTLNETAATLAAAAANRLGLDPGSVITVAGDQSRVADIHRPPPPPVPASPPIVSKNSPIPSGRTAAGSARTADALRQDTRAAERWLVVEANTIRQVQRDRAAIAAQPTIAADCNAAADGQTGGVTSTPRRHRRFAPAAQSNSCPSNTDTHRRSLGRIDRDLTAIAAGCAGTTGPEETAEPPLPPPPPTLCTTAPCPKLPDVLRCRELSRCRGQGRDTAGARKPAATGRVDPEPWRPHLGRRRRHWPG